MRSDSTDAAKVGERKTHHKTVAVLDEHLTQLSIAPEEALNVPLLHAVGQAADVDASSHVLISEDKTRSQTFQATSLPVSRHHPVCGHGTCHSRGALFQQESRHSDVSVSMQ